jgi:hypothetical protein|nr:MAG TPA_asm: hypothetical protein [Caudoviricetes sp.]
MARVNGGIYKKYRNSYKKLCDEWKTLRDENFDEGVFLGEYLDLFDFLDSANTLYEEVEKMRIKIESLLESQKFELEDKEKDYNTFVLKLKNIENELSSRASDVRNIIGCDVSENERYSLDKWKI